MQPKFSKLAQKPTHNQAAPIASIEHTKYLNELSYPQTFIRAQSQQLGVRVPVSASTTNRGVAHDVGEPPVDPQVWVDILDCVHAPAVTKAFDFAVAITTTLTINLIIIKNPS